MATVADHAPPSVGRDHGFFLGGAVVMTVVIVAGFSVQLAMGRSSFAAPPLVHAHAVVFMGWMRLLGVDRDRRASPQQRGCRAKFGAGKQKNALAGRP